MAGITLTSLLVPSFAQMLGALSGWLDKAEAEGQAGDALLAARLAPDMFPLATQVRFACVQAYEAVARLSGKPLPPVVDDLLEEGRQGGEHPGSIAEARERIRQTVAMLDSLPENALDADPASMIVHALPNGMTFDFTAERYARDWALPQFSFHVMTAYAILRANGVPLGKADYVGHLLPFLRTAPEAQSR